MLVEYWRPNCQHLICCKYKLFYERCSDATGHYTAVFIYVHFHFCIPYVTFNLLAYLVESTTSSIGLVDEEDSFKASPTVPPKEHLIAKDSLGSCDSTDGNSSTTPSEGSYNLESAAARHRSAIGRLIEAASAVDRVSEEAFQLTEDSKCIQTPVEIQSDPDSEDSSVEQTADDWSYPNRGGARERRDSGVGSSLTRTASRSSCCYCSSLILEIASFA